MEINRSNYEAFLLDLAEGRLSSGDRERLLEFLASNPDCDPGSDPEELVFLPAQEIPFHEKEQLKKAFPGSAARLSSSNFDLFSIARLEGDLTQAQIEEHEAFLSADRVLERTWEQWRQTKLAPVPVPFPHRNRLKHKPVVTRNLTWISIIAAAAAIALTIIVLARREEGTAPLLSDSQVQLPAIRQRQVSVPVSPPLEADRTLPVSIEDSNLAYVGLMGSKDSVRPMVDQSGSTDIPEQEQGIQYEPLRASRFAHIEPAPFRGTYDRIKPLDLPQPQVHQNGITISRVADRGLQEWVSEVAEDRDFSIWTIADAGIRGINRITGSNMDLVASRDDEGEVSGFRFRSRILNISAPLEKSE